MSDLWPGMPYEAFRRAALDCTNAAEFRMSPYFRDHGDALLRFLGTPWIEPAAVGDVGPQPPHVGLGRAGDRPLRVVHWNIEKGLELDRILRLLQEDPDLRTADIYTLNEVDVGMARSGNRDVGAELARALDCHRVYLPCYLECTKGPGPDADAPGDNVRGLHGLAVLSRHPIREARAGALPECWNYFDFFEKRFGFRQVLTARIDWGGRDIVVATTHLEVRNVPACRARQMEATLDHVERATREWAGGTARPFAPDSAVIGEARETDGPDGTGIPTILTGDFNSNSFRRGGLRNAAREFLRIVTSRPESLALELRTPFRREPLFDALEGRGFDFRSFTDGEPTAQQLLGSAEDLAVLPEPVASFLSRTFGLGSRVLQMRLDWICARHWRPGGSVRTEAVEVAGGPASDHALIRADLLPEQT